MSAEQLLSFFRMVVDWLLPFIPHEALQGELTAAARARAEQVASTAEDLRFGPGPGP